MNALSKRGSAKASLAIIAVVLATNIARNESAAEVTPCNLRPTPHLTVEETMQRCRNLMKMPNMSFTTVHLGMDRSAKWKLRYGLKAGPYTFGLDTIDGHFVGFGAEERLLPWSGVQKLPVVMPEADAFKLAEDFVRKVYPRFDDYQWEVKRDGGGSYVSCRWRAFTPLGSVARCIMVTVFCEFGCVIAYTADEMLFTTRKPPTISKAAAIDKARSILDYNVLTATADLMTDIDSIGEERLEWEVEVKGEGPPYIDHGREFPFHAENPVDIDAYTGEVITVCQGNWGERAVPLKVKFPRKVAVSLDRIAVLLFTPPLDRGSDCLVPETLFRALCGEVKAKEDGKSYVLSGERGELTVRLDSKTAREKESKIPMDLPPERRKGRLYFPLSLIPHVLDLEASWVPDVPALRLKSVKHPPWGTEPYGQGGPNLLQEKKPAP